MRSCCSAARNTGYATASTAAQERCSVRLGPSATAPERAICVPFSLHRCVTFREQRVTSRRGACAPLLVCWTCFCTPDMSALSRYFPGFGL
jgi:hypothetical protein